MKSKCDQKKNSSYRKSAAERHVRWRATRAGMRRWLKCVVIQFTTETHLRLPSWKRGKEDLFLILFESCAPKEDLLVILFES